MAIFEKFTDTIFLKEDSELRRKVDELNKIKDRIASEDKARFDQDLKFSQYGLIGEDRIAYELKNADVGCYVLRDINLEYNGEFAQVDYVIVTRCNCYFVECKNMIGTVTINKEGEFRREYTWRRKKTVEAFYSPYRQVLRHIDIFKKLWRKEREKLISTFGDSTFHEFYRPLIIMANPKGMLNNRYAPKEIKDVTIRVDQLVERLKKDLKAYDKKKDAIDKVLDIHFENQKEIESSAKYVLYFHKKRFINYAKQYKLVDLNSDIDLELKTRLITFRSEMSRKNKVPAYCVFKNDELEEIIKEKPKTITELSKVLQPVKVKVYGKEIVDIICEFYK